jgi:two-component system, NarL family, nitrate/nitrite response regulator NarL
MPIDKDSPITLKREQEVGELLLLGYKNREIAAKLGLTQRTIKAYLGRMFRRYHIHDGVKRVRLAALLASESQNR